MAGMLDHDRSAVRRPGRELSMNDELFLQRIGWEGVVTCR
jgi:hypothetical protein